ncbi:MAG: IclR family transcriptional regulator [Anaerolineaceae bacterium]
MPDKRKMSHKLPGMDPLPENHHPVSGGSITSSASTTVAKAIYIVEILASKADVGINLAELSSLINMPKSSTHRYLVTLQELGLAERKDGDRFYLGTKMIEIAGAFLSKSDLRNESHLVMNELAEKTGETIHLAIPSGREVVYIAKIESSHALGMSSHIGSRLPMYCTSLGKAILAFSNPDLLESILSDKLEVRTTHTNTSPTALRAELVTVRSQGFALDNEENEPGIRCVGAPVLDYSGKAIAAISISGPCERITIERAVQLGPLVWEGTRRVSRRWGYSA